MPKIDESKIADILNSLLTDNIKMGSNLIQDLEKSASEFSKTLDSLDKKVTARAEEVKELAKILANAPKLGKTLKISTILASFVAGTAFAALIYAYPLGSMTYKFIQKEMDVKDFSVKYIELENYTLVLKNQNEAYKRTLERTLKADGREKFREIYMEELAKIKEESK
jgi:hypothetical protein